MREIIIGAPHGGHGGSHGGHGGHGGHGWSRPSVRTVYGGGFYGGGFDWGYFDPIYLNPPVRTVLVPQAYGTAYGAARAAYLAWRNAFQAGVDAATLATLQARFEALI